MKRKMLGVLIGAAMIMGVQVGTTVYGGGSVDPLPPGSSGECVAEATLYLTDSGEPSDDTQLFEVVSDDENLIALLQPLVVLDGFEHVDALAASVDGDRLYFIDKLPAGTGDLGVYDVNTNTVTSIGPVTLDGVGVPEIVLAAFSADGDLVVASNTDEGLYSVDVGTGEATRLGTVIDSGTGLNVNVSGADLAFGSDGTLYLWANRSRSQGGQEAARGLYQLEYPAGFDGAVEAVYLGEDSPSNYTGMAVRDGGTGDLVLSAKPSAGLDSRIDQVSRIDATVVDSFVMFLDANADGQPDGPDPYLYTFGDMTIGELCVDPLPPGS